MFEDFLALADVCKTKPKRLQKKNPNQNVHILQHPKYNKLHAYCNTFNQIVPGKNCATQKEKIDTTQNMDCELFLGIHFR